MELVSHAIPVKSLNQPPFLLMPVGDVQYAGRDDSVAMGMLKRHIEWGVKEGAYFLGMGDYIDWLSPSNRQRLQTAALYDTAMKVADEAAERLVDELYEKALKPSKGRWLGMLEGHHFHEFRDGTTSDQLLADRLGARFLGTSGYVRLVFHYGTRRGPVLIWCHHGAGGGGREASVLNKLDQLPARFAGDIFLMGHHHKKGNAPIDYVMPVFDQRGGPHLQYRTKILAGTGGFLKGYIAGNRHGRVPRGNYVEQKMLPPVSLGGVLVRIRPRWDGPFKNGNGLWRPDMSVEA